jgi:hypothetical protein
MVGSMGWIMTVILRILTTEYFRWEKKRLSRHLKSFIDLRPRSADEDIHKVQRTCRYLRAR